MVRNLLLTLFLVGAVGAQVSDQSTDADARGLLPLLESADPLDHVRAERRFLKLGASGVPALLSAVRKGREGIYLPPECKRAARVLERLGENGVSALPRLIRDLQSSEQYYTLAVLRLIGRLGPHAPQYRRRIREALVSRYVRRSRVWLKKACIDTWYRLDVAPDSSVRDLIKLLYSRNIALRSAAAEVLTARGRAATAATPHLERLLLSKVLVSKLPGGPFGADITIRNPEPLRHTFALALVRVCTAKHVHLNAHIKLLTHHDSMVRLDAALALGHGGAKAAPAVSELSFAIFDDDRAVSREAITALGLIGPAAVAAVPDLQQIMEKGDKAQQVRAAAALRSIKPRRPG